MDMLALSFEDHVVIQVVLPTELFVPSHRNPEEATEPTLEVKLQGTMTGKLLS